MFFNRKCDTILIMNSYSTLSADKLISHSSNTQINKSTPLQQQTTATKKIRQYHHPILQQTSMKDTFML